MLRPFPFYTSCAPVPEFAGGPAEGLFARIESASGAPVPEFAGGPINMGDRVRALLDLSLIHI